MHSDVAISVKNLSKTFRIFGHPGDRIKQALTLGRVHFHQEFTALKDVSFDIKRGETIGIIGRNGSGKSTLLQLICGILKPSFGKVEVKGRVSALLELGAGFNPEFTGRENVYFQGALMGIPKEEMSVRFDEIAAFAEIGDFIDQPVRIYSSGIYVRLAFAVAVNVDSEILVVDEALAVGDAGFRSRCFRRIGELREAGCTILFVSHAMDQIVSLCQQAILIDEGEILFIGRPESAVEQYQSLTSAAASDRQSLRKQLLEPHASAAAPLLDVTDPAAQIVKDEILERFSTELCSDSTLPYDPNGALIEAVRILTLTGDRVNQLISGRTYRCTFRVVLTREAVNVRIAMLIKTNADMDLGGAYSAPSSAEAIPFIRSGSVIDVEFEFKCILNTGIFFINVAVFGSVAGVEFALYGIINAERFRVVALPNCAALAIVDFDCRATLRMNSSEGT